MLGTQLTAAGSLTNSKPPTPPARVLGIVRLYSNSTIKMNQAALESRSIQSLIDKTSIPEAKMYVGGVRSTQDEQEEESGLHPLVPLPRSWCSSPFVASLSNHLPE